MTQKIKVPNQDDADIVLRRGDEPPRSYPVKANVVDVDDDLVDTFLRAIPGSDILAEEAPQPKKEAKQ